MQFFVTGLSEGAFVHKVQGQIFNSEGFNKLGQKYTDHYKKHGAEFGDITKEEYLELANELIASESESNASRNAFMPSESFMKYGQKVRHLCGKTSHNLRSSACD